MKKFTYSCLFIAMLTVFIVFALHFDNKNQVTQNVAKPISNSQQNGLKALIASPVVQSSAESIQKVYVVAYYAGHSPTQTFDVNMLADTLIAELNQVSHGNVTFEIMQRKIISKTAPQQGINCGQYLSRVQSKKWTVNDWETTQCWGSGTVSYEQMLADNQVCDLVNQGKIDEVWFFGFGNGGFWEANMTGKNAFYTNGPIIGNTNCQKPTHILGLNYELPVEYALHSFGHRVEGTMRHFLPQDFQSFQIYGQVKNSCGTVHFPPNGVKDYDYTNATPVLSDCATWTPTHTGRYVTVTCHSWDCSQLGYMRWWLRNLPKKWWGFLVSK